MNLHHRITRTFVFLAAFSILTGGTLSNGYSRTRNRDERTSKRVQQHRPRTTNRPHTKIQRHTPRKVYRHNKKVQHHTPRKVYRHQKNVRRQRPWQVNHHRSPARKRHYSYRRGRWFSVTPRARIAVGAPFGRVVVSLPGIFRTAVFGGQTYYYCDGVFYHHRPHGYVIVRPPRVRYLPWHARRVVISGTAYFLHDDFYYTYRNGFFEVCEPPVVVAESKVNEKAPVTTIMIENSNGSRTPVELEPMGANQWKGPNDEIYDGLPSNEQLREVYGL